MLNRLPAWLPTLQELMNDLGLTPADVPRLARALGVSERTVWRWKRDKAPRMALLSLWWLSRWGHSEWDSEMHNRTELALKTNQALWKSVRDLETALRATGAGQLGQVGRPRRAANEGHPPPAEVLRARPPEVDSDRRRRG